MKKTFLLVFITLILTAFPASANNPTFTIDDTGGQVGSIIIVEVKASASNIIAGQMDIVYDDTVLEEVDSVEMGTALGKTSVIKNKVGGKHIFWWLGTEEMSGGVFCTFYFKIRQTEIKHTEIRIENALFSDADAKPVNVDINNADIYINTFAVKATAKQNGIETDKISNGVASVECELHNYTNRTVNADIWVGAYSNGKLVSLKKSNYRILNGGVRNPGFDVDIDDNITDIRAFTWNNDGSMTPLSDSIIIGR